MKSTDIVKAYFGELKKTRRGGTRGCNDDFRVISADFGIFVVNVRSRICNTSVISTSIKILPGGSLNLHHVLFTLYREAYFDTIHSPC